MADVFVLKQRLEAQQADRAIRRFVSKSPGYEIIEEFVDILYCMAKRGEKIQEFGAEKLVLSPVSRVKLESAKLETKEQIKFVLDYASQPLSGSKSLSLLLDLGPHVNDALVDRMMEMRDNPKKYGLDSAHPTGARNIFTAAASTGDARVRPLLESFKNHLNAAVGREADNALQAMDRQQILVWFP